MKKRKNRRNRKQKRFRFLFLSVLIILGVYFGNIFLEQTQQSIALKEQKQEELDKINDLNKEIAVLEDQYKRRESMEFVEQVARERLGMIKANEKIIEDEGKTPAKERQK